MTTTSEFQVKPDYYTSIEDCKKSSQIKHQTNMRYKNFTQTHFTAGDEEQFQHYRYEKNGEMNDPYISLKNNVFYKIHKEDIFEGYRDLEATNVLETFRYIFYKFKKGIFVKIVNNEMKVFLPFSNVNFINEWSENIKVDPQFGSLHNFIKYANEMENRPFYPKGINEFVNTWYGNNCLVRYEYPIKESDTNISNIKNMLEELVENRKVPDIEFFINRRDFPLLTQDKTEPYYHLWNSMSKPLISHKYDKYVPILSMSKSVRFADVLIPSHEDWGRVQLEEGKFFCKSHLKDINNFEKEWKNKIPTAVFRGSSTGYGVTINDNQRLKVSHLSTVTPLDEDGVAYLDAGITKWNTRPRKFMNSPYLQTINTKDFLFDLSPELTPLEQSKYKYIINISGHVSAFRLSYELSMNSVILLVESEWKMWYSSLLKPYVHYIPVKSDLSDLIDIVKWCRDNDEECICIAKNAKEFYNKYLDKEGIFDFIQKTLVELKNHTGTYLYNSIKPLDLQIQKEYSFLKNNCGILENLTVNSEIPSIPRCYGLLKGIDKVINNFKKYSRYVRSIFVNKLGTVDEYEFLNRSFCVKSSDDSNKIKEHIHETFIGQNCINDIVKEIPNFAYTHGLFKSKKDTHNVITEYIHGKTFKDYIHSDEFDFKEYLFIILQLCLSLHVAQNKCLFVHNDLTPWNILIQRISEPVEVDYVINHESVIRVKTNVIPVIIDYGKSHVIYENTHYGFVNMFKFSTVSDILSILITSIYQISVEKHLERNDFISFLKLANFMSKTTYCPEYFVNCKQLKLFLHNAKKYSNLILEDKHDLERKTPLDLYYYIKKNLRYKFNIEKVGVYNSIMNKGTSRHVSTFILAENSDEKINSFVESINYLKRSAETFEGNIIFLYYIAQTYEKYALSIVESMNELLTENSIDKDKYECEIQAIKDIFDRKLTSATTDLRITIDENMRIMNYNESIFLLPKKVKELLGYYKYNDVSEYREIAQYILLFDGYFKIREVHRAKMVNSLEPLLNVNTIQMKLYNANNNTLRVVASEIYTDNILKLKSHTKLYESVVKLTKNK